MTDPVPEPRDASSGAGLDVTVTLPAPVVEKIREAAKERGEDSSGWCRATLIKCVAGLDVIAEVSGEELAFDVRMALARDPATKDLDPLVMRAVAYRLATRLERARLLFFRKPRPLLRHVPCS